MIYFCKVSLFQVLTRFYYHLFLEKTLLALTRFLLHFVFIFLQKLDRNMGFPQILTPKFLP